MWPKTETLDDVLPHIVGKPEFSVNEREWGWSVDYNYAGPTTFDNPVAMECRGLKFGKDRKLIARPYHKFHNVGEKEHTQIGVLPWGAEHHVLEKLDGSMIHPAWVDGALLWMTRAGVSDVAREAAKRVNARVARCAHDLTAIKATPIFEWVSPENRIVVKYDRDELVLTAIRNWDGKYWTYGAMRGLAEGYGIPVVKAFASVVDAAAFMESVRGLQDAEGYVVRWPDGRMVKVKAEAYVKMHKAKDGLTWEKDVIALVLENRVDDVLPLLDGEDKTALETYAGELSALVSRIAVGVADGVAEAKTRFPGDRKRFALEHVANMPRPLRHVAYHVWEGKDARAELARHMLKHTGSRTAVEELRCILGPVKWDRRIVMDVA